LVSSPAGNKGAIGPVRDDEVNSRELQTETEMRGPTVDELTETVTPRRRPWGRAILHYVRRLHLYAGLFLLPWVLLYAVTAFLFNHPSAFADRPTRTFGRAETAGTPLELYPAPRRTAEQVVEALRARGKPAGDFRLVRPEDAHFTREFAFAMVAAGPETHSVLVDVAAGTGTVRTNPTSPPPPPKAPFDQAGVVVPDPAAEKVKLAIPMVLARVGVGGGDVTVTSVPDVAFLMEADGQLWRVTYNGTTGAVTGRPADAPSDPPSTRTLLARLHLAHGYPGSGGPRWYWALVVDAVSVVMVFWVASGLLMWWQLRAVRVGGVVALASGVLLAAWLIVGMMDVFAAR
jgi:hypothetical protein